MNSDNASTMDNMFKSMGFYTPDQPPYPSIGDFYMVPSKVGGGYFWSFSKEKNYHIKIHNFYFHEDVVADFPGHIGLSICDYYSVSGEELDPYQRLKVGHIRFKNYENYHFKALIHKDIPIQTVEIEFYPSYYNNFLSEKYGALEFDFDEIFQDIDWCKDFPEMETLLSQIWNYRGVGIPAMLFFDSMVSQAVSLIIEYNIKRSIPDSAPRISEADAHSIEIVNKYIGDHFYGDISIDKLCKIACFGRTKLKTLFKQYNNCTITEYIADKRLAQAEALLKNTSLTIEQISYAVGYSNPSRFASLFKKNTGLYPSDFRNYTKK